jgi:hypothetical protein
VERRSAPALLALQRLPRWVVPVLMVLPLGAGMLIHGWPSLICLGALVVFLGWLTYLSWPVIYGRGRLLRVLVLGLLLAVAVMNTTT